MKLKFLLCAAYVVLALECGILLNRADDLHQTVHNFRQHPGVEWCQRCKLTWMDGVSRHYTPMHFAHAHGFSWDDEWATPLCEDCWSALTPAERWDYYENWLIQHGKRDRIETCQKQVEAGR